MVKELTEKPEFVYLDLPEYRFTNIVGHYYNPDDLNTLIFWQDFNEEGQEVTNTIYEYHGKFILEIEKSNEGATFTEEGDFQHWNIDYDFEYIEIQLINP